MVLAIQKPLFNQVPQSNRAARGDEDNCHQKTPWTFMEPARIKQKLNDRKMQDVNAIRKITILSKVAYVQEQTEINDHRGNRKWFKDA
jgi:hypothetical protein